MNNKEYFTQFDSILLKSEKPSTYFEGLLKKGTFPDDVPFHLIKRLKNIKQSPKYHPEGDVWNHTMEVVDHAAYYKKFSDNQRVFMWAAFLHDVGKATTTKVRKGRITAYDHDIHGEKIAREFLEHFTDDTTFISATCRLIRWHMQPFHISKGSPYARLKEMSTQVSLQEVALFSLCDRLGRGKMDEEEVAACKKMIKKYLIASHAPTNLLWLI